MLFNSIVINILIFLFFLSLFTFFIELELSKNWRIIMAIVMIGSLIGLIVCGYFRIVEMSEENKLKTEMAAERIEYNEKKKNELLTEKFKLQITDILIEPVSETKYYKVTTNTGIYKLSFAYDTNDKIIGFKEFKQITSISQEGNHEQGSHN
ncbi:hypothetical protein P9027_30370 [Bacillus thuringiensis]|uniref:hypothetical protein n=1 Tax=Bacillus thuringiensis TaxID=1428 RepID=UPI002DBEA69C|nr:hypothetical protein [Bacillus thuringiensis]MEC3226223.1 hypothetical protein [Bacillus thuringiensis]MEC3463573.1 hypothetical protein [Bacillus thuringiensis]MEC3556634.1 hypothetical protein [Bacillus thuringiensis]MED2055674.1 hypothetical protein [Bacillus thuringiensis]